MVKWKFSEGLTPRNEHRLQSASVTRDTGQPVTNGQILVACIGNSLLSVTVTFSGNPEKDEQELDMKWCINNGVVIDDLKALYRRKTYSVSFSLCVELARLLVTAKQVRITGHELPGPQQELEFRNLTGGENVNKVLKACGC